MVLSVLTWVRTFCRPPLVCLRGDNVLAGDDGTVGASLAGGLNICDGSTLSLKRVLRGFVATCGVSLKFAVVLLRIDVLFVVGSFFGAGVNSSLASSLLKLGSSVSGESITTRRRVAALREGLVGDAADIFAVG